MFWCGTLSVQWITAALQTVTPKHRDLQQILIHIPFDFAIDGASMDIRQAVGETTYDQWLDLDRLLVRLWESHTIRPMIRHTGMSPTEAIDRVRCLLPEMTKRRKFGPIEYLGRAVVGIQS